MTEIDTLKRELESKEAELLQLKLETPPPCLPQMQDQRVGVKTARHLHLGEVAKGRRGQGICTPFMRPLYRDGETP